jgi:hypothetical protein
MEILEDQEQWLNATFSQEEMLAGVKRALTALGGIEDLPLRVVDRHVQEGQEGWQCRLQRSIKGE